MTALADDTSQKTPSAVAKILNEPSGCKSEHAEFVGLIRRDLLRNVPHLGDLAVRKFQDVHYGVFGLLVGTFQERVDRHRVSTFERLRDLAKSRVSCIEVSAKYRDVKKFNTARCRASRCDQCDGHKITIADVYPSSGVTRAIDEGLQSI